MRIKSTVRKDRMKITTEAEISAEAVRWLRNQAEMSQADFWASLGIKQPTGAHYEAQRNRIPKSVRILIFVKYVAGIELDVSTEAGGAELARLAVLQEADKAGCEHVGTALADAIGYMKLAAQALQPITKARSA